MTNREGHVLLLAQVACLFDCTEELIVGMLKVLIVLTFLSTVVLQPLTCEGPLIQAVLETFNDEGLSSKNNM